MKRRYARCFLVIDPPTRRGASRHDPHCPFSANPSAPTPAVYDRQSAAFAREGVELDVSTLADWVGGCVAALDPILSQPFSRVVGCETRRIRAVAIYRSPLLQLPSEFDW
jgi:Transposase IS66 family